ncbi:molecular chaperone [Pseudomonas typographi]|uniref:molecular chaperone n=1 Tax=Pseudomonas typographi TaxID=2715964 RepID=UPI001686EF5D|nr:molecular chaperone [Pseudomonas typographi]MBD1554850.1 molecular chaperone [Pseudomonas typographi]
MKRNPWRLVVLAATCGAALSGATAAAAMPVAPVGPRLVPGALVDTLAAGRSSMVKQLGNTGQLTAFVQVELAQVTFTADGQSHEVPLPADGMLRPLLVTPARFILPAGGSQLMRMIYRGTREQERYFRLRYRPVAPRAGDVFAATDEDLTAYAKASHAGVQVLHGYGGVLIVSPEHPYYNTQRVPGANALVLSNQGNSSVILEGLRRCDLKTAACEMPQTVYIRPGRSHGLEKAAGEQWRFELVEGKTRHALRYPE